MDIQAIFDSAMEHGLFDVEYYERQTGDRYKSAWHGFKHYNREGWFAGLNPSRTFDTGFYLQKNKKLLQKGRNPLIHFIRYGREAGRAPRVGRALLAEYVASHTFDEVRAAADGFTSLFASASTVDVVDVIVPVYNARADTLRCLLSVFRSTNVARARLIVVDDCGDDLELRAFLGSIGDEKAILYVANEENQGFVRSVNTGMSVSSSNDVVLLNTDAEVYGDWLDRLRAHAYAGGKVGTVTPLSNNATILSYPIANEDNNQQLEIDYREIDALARQELVGQSTAIPTGIGFCMYIQRACLDATGLFDDVLFGKGYGEENDFCLRARDLGWSSLCAMDTYAYHKGGASFGKLSSSGKALGLETLANKYPNYKAEVRSFALSDPIRHARRRLDLRRWELLPAKPTALLVEHGLGGGVGKHLDQIGAMWRGAGRDVLRGAPRRDGTAMAINLTDGPELPNLFVEIDDNVEEAGRVLGRLSVDKVHLHSLLGYSPALWTVINGAVAECLAKTYDLTVHDYSAICPRIAMVDWGGVYCDNRFEAHCDVCIKREPPLRFPCESVGDWRRMHKAAIDGARRIIVPDRDVEGRLRRFIPELDRVVLRPHMATQLDVTPSLAPAAARVGVVGAIGDEKGSKVLRDLAADARRRQLPLKYVVYGHTNRDAELAALGVEITGRYQDGEIHELLAETPPSLLLYPSVCPETYCYALDVAIEAGIYAAAFDLGAQASRLRAIGDQAGVLFPLLMAYAPHALNDTLLQIIKAPAGLRYPPSYEPKGYSISEYYDER